MEQHDPDVMILHVMKTTHLDAGSVSCIATTTRATSNEPTGKSLARNSIKCTTQLIVTDGGDVDENRESDMKNNKEPALILKGPSDVSALVGDRVLLKAVYLGRPEPNVKWTRAVRFHFSLFFILLLLLLLLLLCDECASDDYVNTCCEIRF